MEDIEKFDEKRDTGKHKRIHEDTRKTTTALSGEGKVWKKKPRTEKQGRLQQHGGNDQKKKKHRAWVPARQRGIPLEKTKKNARPQPHAQGQMGAVAEVTGKEI